MQTGDDVTIVGGGGHVGLPLAITFATRGLRVVVHDTNEAALARIDRGEMPFREEGAEPLLREVIGRTLRTSADPASIRAARYVVVVVGTPVDEHLNPSLNQMLALFEGLRSRLVPGQCVILRSTVFPGTTAKVAEILRAAGVHLAFCPERVAEGKAITELVTLPQIVSGVDPIATEMARELFARIAPSIIEMSPLEAELTKIFANAWRYIQFATANQFFMIAANHGLDFHRIHDALTRDYPRMAGLPSSGFAAGPCLLKDTLQLAAADHQHFFLGHAAMLVNEGLPAFLVRHAKQHFPLATMRVGILGMAFKPNSDDPRESLSYKLRKALRYEAKEVLATDLHIADPSFVSAAELVERAELIFVATPHREYRSLAIPDGTPIIDVWNFYGKGIGFP